LGFLRNITLFFLFSISLNSIAQLPQLDNLKAINSPYLQFNDVVEYQKKIWFVTNEGIYQYRNNKISLVAKQNHLSKFIKTKNELFVWSIYGSFYKIENNKLIALPFNSLLSKKLKNKIINSVIYTDSTFYISTVIGGGLTLVNEKDESVKTIEIEKEYPYYVARYGKQLISGNNNNPTKKELVVKVKNVSYSIPLAENLSFSKTNVLALKDGSYIFTRQYEAIRFNQTKIINRVFVEKNIESIYQDFEGKIWFALNGGGVISFTDGSFNNNSAVRYLGNKTVISITQDFKGNMWFGTSGNGVYKLNHSKRIKYNAPQIFSSTNQKTKQTESAFIINSTPVVNDSSSKIISTNILKKDTIPPVVFINNVSINGVDTNSLNHYELQHYQNNIEFNISGIFSGNSNLQYKYILEGFETDWNYATQTSAYYSALKPGNYTFKVFAMSDNGVWSKIPAVISFNINPPFYLSFWFIFSIVFVFIALGLIIALLVYRKTQSRNKALEIEKQKALVSELHALRSQMNPHFIFNTLSSIQNFITKNDSKDAVSYLSKFSKLMRATLENTQQQQISIKNEVETLSLYMDLEKLRLNNKFSYQITVDENIDELFEEIPPMLIQPYVENAIWHGISHKEGKGTIKIAFNLLNENLIRCSIEDDGIGRIKANEINGNQKKKTSLGMSITKERLELINSLKDSKLNVTITDLEENNEAKGTKIELFIPLD